MQAVAEGESAWLTLPADDILRLLPEKEMMAGEAARAVASESAESLGGEVVAEARGLLRRLERISLEDHLRAMQQVLESGDGHEQTARLKEFQVLAEKLSKVKDSVE